MVIGDQDHRRIAVPMPVLPRGRDEPIDFLGHQILAGTALSMEDQRGGAVPAIRSWRDRIGDRDVWPGKAEQPKRKDGD